MIEHDDDAAARLLRETLRERASAVDSAAPGLPAAPRLLRGGAARPVLVAAAAAAVAALAVTGVANVRATSPASSPAPSPALSPTSSLPGPTAVWADETPGVAATTRRPRSVPAGWKQFTALGVQLWTPQNWKVQSGILEGCITKDPSDQIKTRPVGEVFVFFCRPGVQAKAAERTGPPPSDTPVRRSAPGRAVAWWPLGKGDALVVAAGAESRALVDRVIGTVRRFDVDVLGCPTKPVPGRIWTTPRPGLPRVRLAPGVTDIVACLYGAVTNAEGDRLWGSGRLGGAARAALRAALTAAPAGSRFGQTTEAERRAECDKRPPESTYVVLRLHTDEGVSTMVVPSLCLGRYVDTPDARSDLTADVSSAASNAG